MKLSATLLKLAGDYDPNSPSNKQNPIDWSAVGYGRDPSTGQARKTAPADRPVGVAAPKSKLKTDITPTVKPEAMDPLE